MAHPEQLRFVETIKGLFPEFFSSTRVLEIGSLDITGSVRQYFEGSEYIGVDIAAGPGVDTICQGQDYNAPAGSFDIVISCEAMEHNPYWAETLANMIRLCRPGGMILMTCASTARREHGTARANPIASPNTIRLGWNYYRNLTEANFRSTLPLGNDLEPLAFFSNWKARDLYMIGFKRGAASPASASQHITAIHRHYRSANIRHGLRTNYFLLRLLILMFGEARCQAWRIRMA